MPGTTQHHDVVIIGAGFGGMYMLIKAREQGLTAHHHEAMGEIGRWVGSGQKTSSKESQS